MIAIPLLGEFYYNFAFLLCFLALLKSKAGNPKQNEQSLFGERAPKEDEKERCGIEHRNTDKG